MLIFCFICSHKPGIGGESQMPEKDQPLAGGNVSHVSRSGNTVRREQKPNSTAIHALLKHLEQNGYEYAPKYLGIDDRGREILSYIEGEAGNYPLKNYMRSDSNLRDIAKMLRLYHEAVSDFPFDDSWQPLDCTPRQPEVICHNDFAVYNIIFQNGQPKGIIDFDMAAPGPRLWDIAYTMYTCVPLSRFQLAETGEKVHYDPVLDAGRIKKRLALFLESYGTDVQGDHIGMVLLRLQGLCTTIKRKACEGNPAFRKMIDEGHLIHYQKDMAFISEHRPDWT